MKKEQLAKLKRDREIFAKQFAENVHDKNERNRNLREIELLDYEIEQLEKGGVR